MEKYNWLSISILQNRQQALDFGVQFAIPGSGKCGFLPGDLKSFLGGLQDFLGHLKGLRSLGPPSTPPGSNLGPKDP